MRDAGYKNIILMDHGGGHNVDFADETVVVNDTDGNPPSGRMRVTILGPDYNAYDLLLSGVNIKVGGELRMSGNKIIVTNPNGGSLKEFKITYDPNNESPLGPYTASRYQS